MWLKNVHFPTFPMWWRISRGSCLPLRPQTICETSAALPYIFDKWMWYVWQLPSNSCTYQDKVLCSLPRRRRCTSSWWTLRSTILKIGPPSGDLLDVARQSLTLKTCHTQQWISFSCLSEGPAAELTASSCTFIHCSHSQPGTTSWPLFRHISTEKKAQMQKAKGGGGWWHLLVSRRCSREKKKQLCDILCVWLQKRQHTDMVVQQDSSILDVRSAAPFCWRWIPVIFVFFLYFCCSVCFSFSFAS